MFGEVLFCLVGKMSLHFIKAQKKKKEKKDNQGNTDRRMDRLIDRHSLQDRTQGMIISRETHSSLKPASNLKRLIQ